MSTSIPPTTSSSLASVPRDRILALLKRQGPQTLNEVADYVGLSRTATRAHLLKLEDAELIARVAPLEEHRGRPPLTYRLTTAGDRTFPTDDADVLSALLDFLKHQGHASLMTRFFEDLWNRRAREFDSVLREQAEGDGFDARLRALQIVLERGNFMPHTDVQDGVVRVCECHCPLPAAARATRIPCRLEANFIAQALRSELVDTSFSTGAPGSHCLFTLQGSQFGN